MDIRFEWDELKRMRNLRVHGLDFRDAAQVFRGPTFTFEDDRYPYSEQRFVTLGFLRTNPVVIVHTEDAEHVRIISIRRADTHEEALLVEKTWLHKVANGLEEDPEHDR